MPGSSSASAVAGATLVERILGLSDAGFDIVAISHILGLTLDQVDEALRGEADAINPLALATRIEVADIVIPAGTNTFHAGVVIGAFDFRDSDNILCGVTLEAQAVTAQGKNEGAILSICEGTDQSSAEHLFGIGGVVNENQAISGGLEHSTVGGLGQVAPLRAGVHTWNVLLSAGKLDGSGPLTAPIHILRARAAIVTV